jgi:hypothetical protein
MFKHLFLLQLQSPTMNTSLWYIQLQLYVYFKRLSFYININLFMREAFYCFVHYYHCRSLPPGAIVWKPALFAFVIVALYIGRGV